ATDGMLLEAGNIYIGIPNHHLLVKDGKIAIGHGPAENRWRPSIDVLFRSVASSYNSRAIGIVLTGMLDDGTAGMLAVKHCGGTCIVQDPQEAEYPAMPLSVLDSMDVDYCLPVTAMGLMIQELAKRTQVKSVKVPPDVKKEAEIAEKLAIGMEQVDELGLQSRFTCPDCGGVLWEIKGDKINRYRCHTGHSYSENDLLIKQAEEAEGTLWVAIRLMEERRNLLKKMESDARRRGFKIIADGHLERSNELQAHITRIKCILIATQRSDHT
ncbi:MAG TPA: chemotaxis protein CheB, partial [Chitinophagaceae bacterium]|nr:chemotaxis protein CheB [Chitinophagaceae bacterium]